MSVAVDLRPLRASPAFRRLWLGHTASALSGQVAVVAVLFQVWEQTGSTVWVGSIGLANGLATAALGLAGGTLADRVERRTLALMTAVGAVVAAVLLAVQAVAGLHAPLLVLLLVAAQTGSTALGAAARRTFVPRLLGRDLVGPGLALQHLGFQVAVLAGPVIGGLVVVAGGAQAAFAVDAVVSALALYALARLPRSRAEPDGSPRSTLAGLRYVAGRPVLRGALLTDLAQTLLAMPIALFPAVNQERFGGDPRTLGLFLSAVAIGGTLAGLLSGPVARAPRPGLVAAAAAAVWGLALAGFGLAGPLVVTLGCLAVAGAADTISVICRGTLVQLATPDGYRGRISSVEYVVGAGGPGLGDARAGFVAGFTGPETAAVAGGLACAAAVGLVLVTHRPLRTWTPAGRDTQE